MLQMPQTLRHALGSLLLLSFAAGCPSKSSTGEQPPATRAPTKASVVTISIVGTNDLHGHLSRLPMLAGFIHNLRDARKQDGAVVLLDAGDMFQGTLESNLTEGASVVDIYNAMGYTAATIGNHEFDFGPVGEKATPTAAGDDPRGALKARLKQARFPILAANIVDAKTKQSLPWAKTHLLHKVAPAGGDKNVGVTLGIIGVTTTATPYTTIAANFTGLRMWTLQRAIVPLAKKLRAQGASAIIVVAHAGGRCHGGHTPKDLTKCDKRQEIFQFAKKLPAGTVDVIVAGHTHARMAHQVNGVAIIESLSKGVAFGRIDLKIDTKTKRLIGTTIQPTRWLCKRGTGIKKVACEAGEYEGKKVVADKTLSAMADKAMERARKLRDEPLGVTLKDKIKRSRARESALGNMVADLMRQVRPKADVALTNGGGLRADLPAGPLTYGRLYEAQPFDNRFAIVKLTAAEFSGLLAKNLRHRAGIFSVSGLRAKASCAEGKIRVDLFRPNGNAIPPAAKLTLATNDFLASGGDGAFRSLRKRPGAITVETGETIRDAIAAALRKRGGVMSRRDFFSRKKKRLQFPGQRPMRCK